MAPAGSNRGDAWQTFYSKREKFGKAIHQDFTTWIKEEKREDVLTSSQKEAEICFGKEGGNSARNEKGSPETIQQGVSKIGGTSWAVRNRW